MFWVLFIIVITTWLALLKWKGRKLRNAVKQYPCDIPTWPVLGHSHHWIGSAEVQMASFRRFGLEAMKQGGMTHMWLGSNVNLMVTDPKMAEYIMKVCLEKCQRTMKFIRLLTGKGLIFAPVDVWRPRRKIAAPMFNQKYLNSFVQVFAKQSTVMADQLKPVADGRDFSIWKYATTNTFDSVCETNFNLEMNSQKLNNHPFINAFEEFCALVGDRIVKPWLHRDFVYRLLPQSKRLEADIQYMRNFIDKVVQDKRQEMAQKEKSGTELDLISEVKDGRMKSFLDMLMERSGGPSGYNNVEMREEILVTILAGTDTTAIASSTAFVLLSRFTEEQEKVYQELRDVFGDSDRLLEAEDLPKLKYLDLFVKETLRMYPPVPGAVRDVNEDITLPCGKTLVAGMGITFNIWAMHRNPQYWGEDVDTFRPERFLTPLKHPAQFIPFSYGMRNCLGYQYAVMSMKTMIATVVRRYRLLPPTGLPREELRAPLRTKFNITMKHVENYVLRLEPRN